MNDKHKIYFLARNVGLIGIIKTQAGALMLC